METLKELTYLAGRLSACEAAMTASTGCGLVKFLECSKFLYGKRFLIKLTSTVYKSYVRPIILHGSEAWCLKKARLEFYEGQRNPC